MAAAHVLANSPAITFNKLNCRALPCSPCVSSRCSRSFLNIHEKLLFGRFLQRSLLIISREQTFKCCQCTGYMFLSILWILHLSSSKSATCWGRTSIHNICVFHQPIAAWIQPWWIHLFTFLTPQCARVFAQLSVIFCPSES